MVGIASKRSPDGILVRETTVKYSTNSIVYPDGDGFSEVSMELEFLTIGLFPESVPKFEDKPWISLGVNANKCKISGGSW